MVNSDIKEIIIELELFYDVSQMDPSILIIWTTSFFILRRQVEAINELPFL